MKRHVHGVISLFLVAGAMATALVSVWQASIFWGKEDSLLGQES